MNVVTSCRGSALSNDELHLPARYAAELHDFLTSDVKRWYPDLRRQVICFAVGWWGVGIGALYRQALQRYAQLHANCITEYAPFPQQPEARLAVWC